MKHPIQILNDSRPLTDHQWTQLAQNCSRQYDDDAAGYTIFYFAAGAINDSYDRLVVANQLDHTHVYLRQPHCVCEGIRTAIDCDCTKTNCYHCKQEFIAMQNSCDSESCVNDDCPLCCHWRDDCGTQHIKDAIIAEYNEAISDDPDLGQAHAYHRAISRVLAPGVGEAPVFPVTVRLLNELVNPAHPNLDPQEWSLPDGTFITRPRKNRAWLEYTILDRA